MIRYDRLYELLLSNKQTPGEMGDCEALRDTLHPNVRKDLRANILYWMTDRTFS
jgi:hypothetical protein